MSIITFKTPEDPIKIIIPRFLRLNSKINAELIKIAPPDELQDIKIEYGLGEGYKPKARLEGVLDQYKFAKYVSIEAISGLEPFLLLYEKLKSQGYSFNHNEIFLSVSFQSKYSALIGWSTFIDVTKDSIVIHSAPYMGHEKFYDFDREGYVQELEKRGLERLTEEQVQQERIKQNEYDFMMQL